MLGAITAAIRAVFSWLETLVKGLGGVFFPEGRPSIYGYILLIALTLLFIDFIFSLFGGGADHE